MEKGIILRGRQGQLQNIPDEVRQYCAAAASLRLKVSDIGHRHIVGNLQSVIPFLIAIHGTCTETPRVEFSRVSVNSFGSSQKFPPILEQGPVVIQIVVRSEEHTS